MVFILDVAHAKTLCEAEGVCIDATANLLYRWQNYIIDGMYEK